MVDFKRHLEAAADRFEAVPIGTVFAVPMPKFTQTRHEAIFVELLNQLRPKNDTVGTVKIMGDHLLLTLYSDTEQQLAIEHLRMRLGSWLNHVETKLLERGGEFQPKAKPKVVVTRCSVCGEPQFEAPGGMVCKNGHGGAPPLEEGEKPDIVEDQHPPVGIMEEIIELQGPPLAPPSGEQESALQRLLRGQGHAIVTGAAGSGKSHLIKHLALRAPITITATTGKAALLVDGVTVDRLFCFGRSNWEVWSQDKLEKNMMSCAKIIVVDEGSMAGAKMLNLLFKLANRYRKRLILVGDWAQASPVLDDWAVGTEFFSQADYIKLTECHRQSSGPFLTALNSLRLGKVDDQVRTTFQQCLVNTPPSEEEVVRMYATNKETEAYNDQRLVLVAEQTPIVEMRASFSDMRNGRGKPFEPSFIERQLEESPVAHKTGMRCGARVLMTINDTDGRWVNGEGGVVTDIVLKDGKSIREHPYNPFEAPKVFDQHISHIVVKLDRYNQTVAVERTNRQTNDVDKQPLYAVNGFPLRLGWAITIHRSQGTTLDRAFLDMRSILRMPGESRHGLAYVALSRTRTVEGLQIANWSDDAVYCSEVVRPYV